MDPLPPIPCPRDHRWREFRITLLPPIIFVFVAVGVFFIWGGYISPPTLVGEVEVIKSSVIAIQPGTVIEVKVTDTQIVTNGQLLAETLLSDPRLLESERNFYDATVDIETSKLTKTSEISERRLEQDRQNNEFRASEFRLNLADARAQLPQVKNEWLKSQKLWEAGAISEAEWELAEATYNALVAKIAVYLNTLEGYDRATNKSPSLNAPIPPKVISDEEIGSKLRDANTRRLNALMGRMSIYATSDGVVAIHRRAGENFVRGETLFTITSQDSANIHGFIRQPIALQPKKGMTVEVRARTRTGQRQFAQSKIDHVGLHMEPITTNLLAASRGLPGELGLKVNIRIPESLRRKVVPGEIVDVTLVPSK